MKMGRKLTIIYACKNEVNWHEEVSMDVFFASCTKEAAYSDGNSKLTNQNDCEASDLWDSEDPTRSPTRKTRNYQLLAASFEMNVANRIGFSPPKDFSSYVDSKALNLE